MTTPARPDGAPVRGHIPDTPPAAGPARMVVIWALVFSAAAAGLRVADALPGAALGVSRGVLRPANVAALERDSGRRMPMPAYFPEAIAWPPAELRLHSGGSASLWCRQRAGSGLALVVAAAPAGTRGIAAAVLPAAVELQREEAPLDARVATVSRVRDADGAVWQQVQWTAGRQIILVRYRGTLDELLKIARSVRE
jgi:hypothetical protein